MDELTAQGQLAATRMRGRVLPRIDQRLQSPLAIGALLFVFAFGLYGLTAGAWQGYDAETADVAASLVEHGDLLVRPGGLIPAGMGAPSHGDARLYSRAGLTQPLLSVPFYLVGSAYDALTRYAHDGGFEGRRLALYLYTPFIAAVGVVALFGLVLLRRRSLLWATVLALLFGCASIAWPYAKIGMDTTAMTMVLLSFWAAAWAARWPRPLTLATLGLMLAGAANAKPTAVVAALPALLLVIPTLRMLDRRRLLACAAALMGPLLAGLAAVAWYNHYRTGSVSDFADPYWQARLSTPFNLAGLFLSPGKGLLLYSPLAIFGALGARALWREDRPLALASLASLAFLAVPIAMSAQWSDETWGPRYVVPVAWTLLLPIAWWTTTRRRAIAVAVVAAIGVSVQASAIATGYAPSAVIQQELAGVPVFVHTGSATIDNVPYGNDGPRWVAPLSGVVIQAELVAAWAKAKLLGDGVVLSYSPFEGPRRKVDLNDPDAWLASHGLQIPDFWWAVRAPPPSLVVFAVALALLGTLAALLLARALWLATSTRRPSGQHAMDHS